MAEGESAPTLRDHLARLLDAIDRGELDATPTMRARIEGAVTALSAVDGQSLLIPNDRLV